VGWGGLGDVPNPKLWQGQGLAGDQSGCCPMALTLFPGLPLPQLMEAWDAQLVVRCADDFEAMMRSAASDSAAEGRQAARRTFAAYAAKAPDHAAAFLGRLEPGIKDKLSKGLPGGASKGEQGGSCRVRRARASRGEAVGCVRGGLPGGASKCGQGGAFC
jgi:hypothetical protein